MLYLTPCLLILPEFLELDGIWAALPVSDALGFATAVLLLLHGKRQSWLR